MTIEAARAHGLWVGVCGEMAGDITLTPLLIGLGVDELSAGAALVPRVKRAVQAIDFAACQQLIEDIRHLDSAAAILEKCEAVARAHYGELF
jgi:phosphotransferase system enzyme I (PtsI)